MTAKAKVKTKSKATAAGSTIATASSKKAPKKATVTPKLAQTTAVAPPVVADVDADLQVKISEKDFILRLTEKLTHFDATMVLEAAMLTAGVARQEGNFKKKDAREICLALIKRGGPAFAVGTGVYREVIG